MAVRQFPFSQKIGCGTRLFLVVICDGKLIRGRRIGFYISMVVYGKGILAVPHEDFLIRFAVTDFYLCTALGGIVTAQGTVQGLDTVGSGNCIVHYRFIPAAYKSG